MAKSYIDRSSACCSGLLLCLITVILFLGIAGIIYGPILASSYVQNRNTRQLYTNTSCNLLNYSIFEHQCMRCAYGCTYYKCFNENFTVSYPISNDTYVTGVLISMSRDTPHIQTQIGKNYSCFYQLKNINTFTWNLPGLLGNLIGFCIGFGSIGLSIVLLPVLFLLDLFSTIVHTMDKIEQTKDEKLKQRIIIVHGSAMTPGIINRHWYKWLQIELQKLGFQAIAPSFPDEKEAKESIWITFLKNNLAVKENDILIGHSSGAMTILRLCEQMKIKGLILVSAGYDNENENQSWNWNKIKSNAQWIEQFHSCDDPFTPINSSRYIAKQLQSNYHEFNDRNHFLCTEFMDLINIIKYRCELIS